MGKKHKSKNRSAQRHSGMSKLPEVRRQETEVRMKTENRKTRMRPAQQDSGNSILKNCPYRPLAVRLVPQSGNPYRPLVFKNTPAQQDSKMSNWEVGILRILRILGILGGKTKNKNIPAQRHSKMSN